MIERDFNSTEDVGTYEDLWRKVVMLELKDMPVGLELWEGVSLAKIW